MIVHCASHQPWDHVAEKIFYKSIFQSSSKERKAVIRISEFLGSSDIFLLSIQLYVFLAPLKIRYRSFYENIFVVSIYRWEKNYLYEIFFFQARCYSYGRSMWESFFEISNRSITMHRCLNRLSEAFVVIVTKLKSLQ